MQFALIEPTQAVLRQVEAADLEAALRMIGLQPGKVDHAVVWSGDGGGLAIVVAEFGLFEPPERQNYFSLWRRLYAGNAALYAFDDEGSTIDMEPDEAPPPVFYRSVDDIERAIADGWIERPQISVNREIVWQWPQPRPNLDAITASLAASL